MTEKSGGCLITIERLRQVGNEGFSSEHDDLHIRRCPECCLRERAVRRRYGE